MKSSIITADAFNFLINLEKNNNREWFNTHKITFKTVESAVKQYYQNILEQLKQHDEIERLKMFRIYRDVRFSKDKTPYKTHFAGSFSRAGASRRGGYYLRIKPKETFAAVGFWEPNKEDLFRIRKEFEMDATKFRAILANHSFKAIWGELQGDAVKTAPKGFGKDHQNIDLIKRKQFIFVRNFSDDEVLSPSFIDLVDESFKAIRPYFDLMSSVLTTNLNGELLID